MSYSSYGCLIAGPDLLGPRELCGPGLFQPSRLKLYEVFPVSPSVKQQAELEAQDFLSRYNQLLQRSPYSDDLKEKLADRLAQYTSGLQTDIGSPGMVSSLSYLKCLP